MRPCVSATTSGGAWVQLCLRQGLESKELLAVLACMTLARLPMGMLHSLDDGLRVTCVAEVELDHARRTMLCGLECTLHGEGAMDITVFAWKRPGRTCLAGVQEGCHRGIALLCSISRY